MKRAILCAAVLCLAFQPPAWRYVASTADERFFASDERTDRKGSTVRRWERSEPRADTEEGCRHRAEVVAWLAARVGEEGARRFDYATLNLEYDCAEGLAASRRVLYHASDGRVIYDSPRPDADGPQSPPPGSIAERMMLDACKRGREPELQ